MEAFKSIPKVLDGVEDLHQHNDPHILLAEYKRNMKQFIKNVTQQVSSIIDQYERKITELKEENKRLRESGDRQKYLPINTVVKRNNENYQTAPSKFIYSGQRNNLDMMPTAKSNLFTPFDQDIRFSAVLSKYKRGKQQDNNFPVQLINPQPGQDQFHQAKSHFEIKSNRKKQREQQLRDFLQTGKKNMNYTTKRFLQSIGKNKQKQDSQKDTQFQLNRDHSDSSLSIKKNDSGLNQSLGNICNSLDNSFVSKRARSNKKKKSSQIQQQARRKQKQEEEMTKMMKSKGIKNLLMRLRQNVEASPKKDLQIIKSSKLISCGPTPSKQISFSASKKNNSKVMINPVPVDIVKKSMVSKRDGKSSPQVGSPGRKPQSILKQSTIANESGSPTKSILKQTSSVLSKSISGISAIQFAD